MAASRRAEVRGAPGATEDALISAAERHGKAVLVGPVYDTIKRVQDGLVVETVDRAVLRWPLAWAYTASNQPATDPPEAEWFVGAAVIE